MKATGVLVVFVVGLIIGGGAITINQSAHTVTKTVPFVCTIHTGNFQQVPLGYGLIYGNQSGVYVHIPPVLTSPVDNKAIRIANQSQGEYRVSTSLPWPNPLPPYDVLLANMTLHYTSNNICQTILPPETIFSIQIFNQSTGKYTVLAK